MNRRQLFQLSAGLITGEAARRAYSFLPGVGAAYPSLGGVYDACGFLDVRHLSDATLYTWSWLPIRDVTGGVVYIPVID